jgi:hypothetical protein
MWFKKIDIQVIVLNFFVPNDPENWDGFSFSMLWCNNNNTGNNPQEELAKCGYKSERKVKLKNPAMLWWLAGTYCVSKVISEGKNSSKSGNFDEFFCQNNPSYVWVVLDILFVTKW